MPGKIPGQSRSGYHYLALREQSDFGFRNREMPYFQTGIAQSNGPIAQSRLERTPDKREVVGSTPTRPTTLIFDFGLRILERSKSEIINRKSSIVLGV